MFGLSEEGLVELTLLSVLLFVCVSQGIHGLHLVKAVSTGATPSSQTDLFGPQQSHTEDVGMGDGKRTTGRKVRGRWPQRRAKRSAAPTLEGVFESQGSDPRELSSGTTAALDSLVRSDATMTHPHLTHVRSE